MSNNESVSFMPSIEPPWRQSARGSIYCMWDNLPDDLKGQLKQVDRYGTTIEDYHYNVKENQDGGFIVFRNTKAEYDARNKQYFSKKTITRILELKALPLVQANKMLETAEDYEPLGTDPVKVVNGEFFVVIGRKERSETKQ